MINKLRITTTSAIILPYYFLVYSERWDTSLLKLSIKLDNSFKNSSRKYLGYFSKICVKSNNKTTIIIQIFNFF